ncbi:MAG: ArsR/SmtB family transcription factor [Aggregatilineales bacterium]
MADWDFVRVPAAVTVDFQVNQVAILFNGMQLLGEHDHYSGLDNWLVETAHSFTDEQMQTHRLVFHHFGHMLDKTGVDTFLRLMEHLQQSDPRMLLNDAISWMDKKEDSPGKKALLADVETYIAFLTEMYSHKGKDPEEHLDDAVMREVHYLMKHPDELRDRMVAHLQWLWDTHLAAEWRKREAALLESADAFSQLSYAGMDGFEIVEAISGRDMRGMDDFSKKIEDAHQLIFMPSPYVGPYIGYWPRSDNRLILFFRLRQPVGNIGSPALNRADLLVRLNALADETRLQMVDLLHEHGELCAQDFIEKLDLSQSSASRHLRQLTASGYLTVRRRDTAKCYTLSEDRIKDTLKALTRFLHG